MAWLRAPDIDFDGPDQPTSQAGLVPRAGIADPAIVVYTGGMVAAPFVGNIIDIPEPATDTGGAGGTHGYPFGG